MAFEPLPQATIAEEFPFAPTEITDHLRPLLMGPQAKLLRFSEPSEQPNTLIGPYDPSALNNYPYPGAIAGAIEDTDYVKVFIQDALLRYYKKDDGVPPVITIPAGFLNRIKSASTVYKTNAAAVHDPMFIDRGVLVGDVVDVKGVVAAIPYSKRTTIAGFVPDIVPSSIAAATSDPGNKATQIAFSGFGQTAGPINTVEITALPGAAVYNGLLTGDICETYIAEVIQGSIGGDATTALLKITSASGNDNVASIAPAAFAAPTTIGTRGLTAIWNTTGGGVAVPLTDFIVGQKWSIAVCQAFVAPVPTSSGTYTGTQDNTYIIEVIQGGTYASGLALIKITSALGIDASGPTVVNAAAPTDFPVGSLGVLVEFTMTALCKGDKYYIGVVAASDGPIKTLVLTDNLPAGLAPAADLEVQLYIKQEPANIERIRRSVPGVFNWTALLTSIDINSGILAYDETWTLGGVQQPLPVAEGLVHVETRQWLSDLAGTVGILSTEEEIAAQVGTIHPDNPLAFGLFCALQNASGSLMGYVGVTDPDDLNEWDEAFTAIAFVADLYNIVPLSQNIDVLKKLRDHVNDQSSAEVGALRVGWISLPLNHTIPIVTIATTSDNLIALATVSDDPGMPGIQFTRVVCTTGNSLFVTNGVEPGDILRINFNTDAWGQETYDEFTVASITNEVELLLEVPGSPIAIPVAAKIEVWRNLTKTEKADNLGQRITDDFKNRRLRNTWPDIVGDQPGYFAASAAAGLSSGAPSQQGLRNAQLVMPAGFDDLSHFTDLLAGDITELGREKGVWVLAKTLNPGTLYNKYAVTTFQTQDILDREEMVVRNTDGIAAFVLDSIEEFIGVTNVTDDTILTVEQTINEALVTLTVTNITTLLGPIIIEIIEPAVVRRHSVLPDRLVAEYTIRVPYPLNGVEVTQFVVI